MGQKQPQGSYSSGGKHIQSVSIYYVPGTEWEHGGLLSVISLAPKSALQHGWSSFFTNRKLSFVEATDRGHVLVSGRPEV